MKIQFSYEPPKLEVWASISSLNLLSELSAPSEFSLDHLDVEDAGEWI